MKRFSLLAIILLLTAVVAGCAPAPEVCPAFNQETEQGSNPGVSEGDIARDFQVVDLDGNTVNLRDFRGKVIFLNFWATWCPHCKGEMPSMEKIYQDYRDRGFVVLAVSCREDPEKVKEVVKEMGVSFPVFADPQGAASLAYRVKGVPVTFLIDSQGIIREIILGSRNWSDFSHRQKIESLLPK